MDVIIFTECPTGDYYRSLLRLGNVEIRDSRSLYLTFLKVYGSFSFLRKIGSKLGKPADVKYVSFMGIIKSYFSYFELLFTRKKVVVLFAPYSNMSFYLCLLKLFKKDLVYMTSWPYWNEKDYAYKPSYLGLVLWRVFLKNLKIVTISKTAKENLLSYSKEVVQIPHGVDLDLFKVGSKTRKFQVLFVGRIIKEKGIEDLLRAAEVLKDINFVFVGSGSFDYKLKECSLPNVKYLGEVRDRERLSSIFSESHVFVLNSYKIEGWEELYGIVLLEALASGTCVISTDCVGPKEIVSFELGFLIPQKNFSRLKETLEYCYNHKKEMIVKGKAGRLFVEKNYDINKLSEKWNEVLKS